MLRRSYLLGVVMFGLAACQQPHQPGRHIVQVRVRMQTTSDGKDGDTQVLDSITTKNQDQIASLDCCSSGNHGGDVWNAGNDTTQTFNHLTPNIDRDALEGGTVSIGMRSNGRDTWTFIPTIIVIYDRGNPDTWSFGKMTLSADNNSTSRTFAIPPLK